SPGSATGTAATRSSRRNRWASRSPPDWRCASGNRMSSSASVSTVCPERCRSSRRPAIRRRTCPSTTSGAATASYSSTMYSRPAILVHVREGALEQGCWEDGHEDHHHYDHGEKRVANHLGV